MIIVITAYSSLQKLIDIIYWRYNELESWNSSFEYCLGYYLVNQIRFLLGNELPNLGPDVHFNNFASNDPKNELDQLYYILGY